MQMSNTRMHLTKTGLSRIPQTYHRYSTSRYSKATFCSFRRCKSRRQLASPEVGTDFPKCHHRDCPRIHFWNFALGRLALFPALLPSSCVSASVVYIPPTLSSKGLITIFLHSTNPSEDKWVSSKYLDSERKRVTAEEVWRRKYPSTSAFPLLLPPCQFQGAGIAATWTIWPQDPQQICVLPEILLFFLRPTREQRLRNMHNLQPK